MCMLAHTYTHNLKYILELDKTEEKVTGECLVMVAVFGKKTGIIEVYKMKKVVKHFLKE